MQDPVGWRDNVTLDYNVEANFYGAASSNHPKAIWPYYPTLSALIPLGQQRASLPSWSQGGHESGGYYGQMTEAMGCNCNDYMHCFEEADGSRCPDGFGGFDGIEIPSAIGGFVDMHCSHDSSMRSTAAMAAQPYVDYYEHTQDHAFLKQWAYPYVKQTAMFYASYAKLDNTTQKYGFPLACAQEICSGRQHGVRCAFFGAVLHAGMPLNPTHVRVKRPCMWSLALLSGVRCSYHYNHTLCRNGVKALGSKQPFANTFTGRMMHGARFPPWILLC